MSAATADTVDTDDLSLTNDGVKGRYLFLRGVTDTGVRENNPYG